MDNVQKVLSHSHPSVLLKDMPQIFLTANCHGSSGVSEATGDSYCENSQCLQKTSSTPSLPPRSSQGQCNSGSPVCGQTRIINADTRSIDPLESDLTHHKVPLVVFSYHRWFPVAIHDCPVDRSHRPSNSQDFLVVHFFSPKGSQAT